MANRISLINQRTRSKIKSYFVIEGFMKALLRAVEGLRKNSSHRFCLLELRLWSQVWLVEEYTSCKISRKSVPVLKHFQARINETYLWVIEYSKTHRMSHLISSLKFQIARFSYKGQLWLIKVSRAGKDPRLKNLVT